MTNWSDTPAAKRILAERVVAAPCAREDWPKPHAAPITYERYHIQLDGPEACSAVVLGKPLWGANWPSLRALIDAELGPSGQRHHSSDGLLKLTEEERKFAGRAA